MEERKYRRKLIPVSMYDIPALEAWLVKMAAEGLFLESILGSLGIFRIGTAMNVRYCIEPLADGKNATEIEQESIYSDNGWQRVAEYRSLYNVFMAADENAPELHTDPYIQQLMIHKFKKRLFRHTIFMFLIQVLMVIWYLWQNTQHQFVKWFILYGSVIDVLMVITIIMVLVVNVVTPVVQFGSISRLYRKHETDGHQNKNVNHKKLHGLKRTVFGLYLGLAVLLCLSVLTHLAEGMGVPYFTHINKVQGQITQLDNLLSPVSNETEITSGLYGLHAAVFAPVQYGVSRCASQASVVMNYYETVSKCTSRALYEEELKYYNANRYPNSVQRVLDTPLFDGAVYIENKLFKMILVYKDTMVMEVMCYGDKGEIALTEKLPQIAAMMNG